MTRVEALDVAVFPGAAALDIGRVGVDSPPFPHGLGHDRAPIPSRAVDKTVRVLGSSPHCSTNQSPHGGDFPERPQIPTYWRLPARSTWSLDSRTLPRRTLWPFCLCTLKSLFPGNGDRLDLRLVRGWAYLIIGLPGCATPRGKSTPAHQERLGLGSLRSQLHLRKSHLGPRSI
jgi:hypothetical protein